MGHKQFVLLLVYFPIKCFVFKVFIKRGALCKIIDNGDKATIL